MVEEPRDPELLSYAPALIRKRSSLTLLGWIVITLLGASSLGIVLLAFPTQTKCVSPRTYCSAQLRGIGQALYIYAQEKSSGAMFPDAGLDWQKTLDDAGTTVPKQFVCPLAAAGQTSYFYVPGYGIESDPRQVIAYEYPLHRGDNGGHALFQDGHVEFISAPKYQALINSLKLPDGRPWAPHLAAKK